MAREEQHSAYYDEIIKGKSYIDTTLSVQTCVADFLANAFFGKDFRRVVYTNPEYAFRKRVEMLAKGVDENIFISNLDLPFCSFVLAGTPRLTKVMTASEWNGYYDESINARVHFRNTLQDVKVQFFFERYDDTQIAFDIAQVEQLGGYPIRYQQMVYWRNKEIPMPVWITVKDVKMGNESFTESEWLTKNRMYGLILNLEIETARIHINKGKNGIQLPFKWHKTGFVDEWTATNDTDAVYYTQKCILNWAEAAWKIDVCPSSNTRSPEATAIIESLIEPSLKPLDDRTWNQVQKLIPNRKTAEMVEGFFKADTHILFNRIKYNEQKTTISDNGEVSAWIDIVVKPSTYQYWDFTEVYVPSRQGDPIRIKNCKANHIIIDKLHPNSTYTIYFIAHDTSGTFNTIPLEFTTPVWKDETLPVMDDMKPESLTNFEKKEPQKPTIINGKGLIGLEF